MKRMSYTFRSCRKIEMKMTQKNKLRETVAYCQPRMPRVIPLWESLAVPAIKAIHSVWDQWKISVQDERKMNITKVATIVGNKQLSVKCALFSGGSQDMLKGNKSTSARTNSSSPRLIRLL